MDGRFQQVTSGVIPGEIVGAITGVGDGMIRSGILTTAGDRPGHIGTMAGTAQQRLL